MISIRALGPDDWRDWREMRLRALRAAPYAYGSTLSEWQADRHTEKRWRRRLTEVPFNLLALLNDTPAGIVSATEPSSEKVVELISMWVAPFARGQGIGDALVDAVVQWSRSQSINQVQLDVVPHNAHATALYRRHGFHGGGVVDGELKMNLILRLRETQVNSRDPSVGP